MNTFHSPTHDLPQDTALREFLSHAEPEKTAGLSWDGDGFPDYPPTRALVRAAIKDIIATLGIR